MGKSSYDPNSEQAKLGLAFQGEVFKKIQEYPGIFEAELTWDFFNRLDPGLEDFDYACYEKEFGDITFLQEDGFGMRRRYWVECCFILGEKSTRFCEMKRLKFEGSNKWYAFGKLHDPKMATCFVPSKAWNAYVSHTPLREGFRVVQSHLIGENIRAATMGEVSWLNSLK
jgi:hypothetical protein